MQRDQRILELPVEEVRWQLINDVAAEAQRAEARQLRFRHAVCEANAVYVRPRDVEICQGLAAALQHIAQRAAIDDAALEAERHRVSWCESRKAAEAAVRDRDDLLGEVRALKIESAQMKAEKEAYTREIARLNDELASLRRQQVTWQDEHEALENSIQKTLDAENRSKALEEKSTRLGDELSRCDADRRDALARASDLATKLRVQESKVAEVTAELQLLSQDFRTLEQFAGRRAFESEDNCAKAHRELTACRARIHQLVDENQLLRAKLAAVKSSSAAYARRSISADTDTRVEEAEPIQAVDQVAGPTRPLRVGDAAFAGTKAFRVSKSFGRPASVSDANGTPPRPKVANDTFEVSPASPANR